MTTTLDKIIILLVVLIALLVYILFGTFVFVGNAERVEIFLDGEEYAVYNLAEISGTKVLDIKSETGYNRLEITNRGAKMTEASCPDKTDVLSGEITKVGQMIVCSPNRVMVKIAGKDDEKVDKVTY
ncbi:MAG: NusG domain II-containing protein [Clostridia bacterium]|nr:NusG domain II-containing protein [Clostridia bacterium]